jgi:hypothetical protein
VRLSIAALVATLWLVAAAPAHAASEAAYRVAVTSALAQLEGAGTAEERAAAAASRLRSVGPVETTAGSVEPDNRALLAALDARPPLLDDARARLSALAEALAERPAAEAPADADARLRQVLARGEFADAAPNPLQAAIDEALAGVRAWLRSWLPEAQVGPVRGPRAEDLRLSLAIAGALIVLGVVGLLVAGVRANLGPRSVAAPAAPVRAVTWEEAMAEAARLAQSGRYREAIRALYVATMLRGDALGQLRFDRALTNRELLATARARGGAALADRLRPLVERFDRLWYGGASGSAAEYEELRGVATALWPA